MFGINPITAPRPAVDWHSTADDVEPAPGEVLLAPDKVSLSSEARGELLKLQQRDAHVRAHEAAHQAAGGDLTGPASFSYQLGPDGRSYAVGGEVPLHAPSGRTPDETIALARRVRAAALAPSDPSAADLAAASAASQVELRAMQQKRQEGSRAPGPQAPAATPQPSLERVIARAPEAEPFL